MHPLHPVVVHFPIACWALSTLGNVVAAVLGSDMQIAGVNATDHARLLLWVGVSVSPLAMVLGVVDYVQRRHQMSGAANVAHHAGWMGCAFVLYLLSGLFREGGHLMTGLISEVAGFACLIVGGLAASRIVYPDTRGFCRSNTGTAQTIGGIER